jgi:hypothetical protein
MKKKKIAVILLFLVKSALAQDCTPEDLAQKPGTWKAGMQGSVHNVTATDLTKEKSVMAGIHQMIIARYKPMGCQANYSTAFGKSIEDGQTWIADPYYYTLYILNYLCDPVSADKTKFNVAIATATHVNITANVIFSLNNLYAANIPPDDFRGYLKLTRRPGKKDGNYFMGEETVGDSQDQNKTMEYRWLITYSDTLPFSYLSRREYLTIQKQRLDKDLKESPGEKEYLKTFYDNINAYLKKSDEELNQPAICRWNEEERFEKFVDEGTKGSFFAVKPNPAYYHKKLPKSVPQFFTVVYDITQGNPVFEDNMAAIQEAVDFAELKNRLGK